MARKSAHKTALVTGASVGIGEAVALRLAAMGFTVYAAARRTEKMEHLKAHGIKVVHLDITDEASILKCVKHTGPLDILVNNAGYGAYGAIEEVPMAEARRQFEVNIFGLARLTQLAIPHMRQKRWGRIINVSSIGGLGAAPYGGWYHATKFALEGWSSALRQELSPFGVKVVIIRPGAIKSEWAGIAFGSAIATSGKGPYRVAIQAMQKILATDKLDKMSGSPNDIANVVAKAVTSQCPRSAYTAPRLARIMVRINRWAGGDSLRDAINRTFLGLPKTM